jgi:hypothetical protein
MAAGDRHFADSSICFGIYKPYLSGQKKEPGKNSGTDCVKEKKFTVILEILNAEFIFYMYNNGKVREASCTFL